MGNIRDGKASDKSYSLFSHKLKASFSIDFQILNIHSSYSG